MNDLPILSVENLSKSYESGDEQLMVLKDLELSLLKGHSAVILGRSGSGKSTLLHMIGGLDRPDGGSIRVGTRQLEKMRPSELETFRRRDIGFIFQSHFLLDDFSILENVALPAIMDGKNRRESLDRAAGLLDQVGILPRKDHFPRKISGGECQRAAVARALINDPLLILADEPTGNLDEYNSRLVEDLLFRIVEEESRNLVMVTHDRMLSSRGTTSYVLAGGSLEVGDEV